MAASDDAYAALRAARPELHDDLASPTSAAAQALLEEILSMPTSLAPDPAETTPTPGPRHSRRKVVVLAAASIVAFAAVAFAAVQHGDDRSTVHTGPAETQPTPTRTGRLEVTWDLEWEMVPPGASNVTTYEFSGDDVRIMSAADGTEYREVDGRAWVYEADPGQVGPEGANVADLPHHWYDTNVGRTGPHDIDPATLLDRLTAAGPFEPVGDQDVAGVAMQRRRATQPRRTDLEALSLSGFFDDGAVTGLEVWVDDDSIVRRVDISREGVEQGKPFRETWSLVWSDLGEPITIEPPT